MAVASPRIRIGGYDLLDFPPLTLSSGSLTAMSSGPMIHRRYHAVEYVIQAVVLPERSIAETSSGRKPRRLWTCLFCCPCRLNRPPGPSDSAYRASVHLFFASIIASAETLLPARRAGSEYKKPYAGRICFHTGQRSKLLHQPFKRGGKLLINRQCLLKAGVKL